MLFWNEQARVADCRGLWQITKSKTRFLSTFQISFQYCFDAHWHAPYSGWWEETKDGTTGIQDAIPWFLNEFCSEILFRKILCLSSPGGDVINVRRSSGSSPNFWRLSTSRHISPCERPKKSPRTFRGFRDNFMLGTGKRSWYTRSPSRARSCLALREDRCLLFWAKCLILECWYKVIHEKHMVCRDPCLSSFNRIHMSNYIHGPGQEISIV
jgi:hypothetical protein